MPTVYERIVYYEEFHKRKRFSQKGRINVGMDIRRAWTKENHDIALISEWSQEPEGTFHVANYPDWFTSKMDNLIADYVSRIYYKNKKNNEKPVIQSLSKTNTSVPPDPPKRKRKPIPYYTTRKK